LVECGTMMKTLFLLILLSSCGARGPLIFEAPLIEKEESFQGLTANLLANKCNGCHKGFAKEENLLKYMDGDRPDSSALFISVKNGSMPKNAPLLITPELEMVRSYIEKNDVRKINFQEFKTSILVPKCLGCHKKMTDEENLKQWIDVKKPFESKLFLTTQNGSMPKKSGALTKLEMNIIKGYLLNFGPQH
jgi:hypothetical protein